MLHQWFTCVHLLDTYLANLTEDFQLSFTTHQFPSEQHKVVCNQHLHAECGGSATISLEVKAIDELIEDTVLHSRLAQAGYERVKKHFVLPKEIEACREYYGKL